MGIYGAEKIQINPMTLYHHNCWQQLLLIVSINCSNFKMKTFNLSDNYWTTVTRMSVYLRGRDKATGKVISLTSCGLFDVVPAAQRRGKILQQIRW
jgi:hypothetical protein